MPGGRIPFDSLVLAAVCAELQGAAGTNLRRVHQPEEHTVTLRMAHGGYDGLLLISCDPEFPRAYASAVRRPAGGEPPGFARALRQRIEGGRVLAIRQNGFDRLLLIEVGKADGVWTLYAELFGTHANLFLVAPDGRIAARLRKAGPRRPGEPYAPPEPPAPDARTALIEQAGLSKFLARELELLGAEEVMRRLGAGPPVLVPGRGAYPYAPAQLEELEGASVRTLSSLGVALEQHYLKAIPDVQQERRARSLAGQLRRALKARRGALDELRRALDIAARARDLQIRGELILAHAARLPAGADRLETEDYEGRAIVIELDARLTPVENAERLFHRAKKAKAGASDVGVAAAAKGREIEGIERLVSALVDLDTAGLERAEERARSEGWLRAPGAPPVEKAARPFEGHRIRSSEAPGGFTVLWAENATSNDYLTTRVAKPNDFWLHARTGTGAHVVIQTRNRPDRVQKEALLFAARLAARNSGQRHAKYVPVDYTLAKYVRKPRKSPPGFATYSREKTLFVDP
ncbi:MAG: NFACT family protein [Armatimonadetes bacterium]|nr:NFACT family protein [Armatimonadota bacterium]